MNKNRLVYDETTNTTKHVHRESELRRHRRFSHKNGDAVQFVGKDKRGRGLGIVLYETNQYGWTPEQMQSEYDKDFARSTEWGQTKLNPHITVTDELFTHVKVFWQITQQEEIVHKRFVRKCPDIDKGIVVQKK